MGLLNLFSKPARPPLKLSAGSFTLDRSGHVPMWDAPDELARILLDGSG